MNKKTQKLKLSEKMKNLARPVQLKPEEAAVVHQTNDDFKHAVLVVSLLVNAFFLTGWLVVQVTTQYNDQIIAYLNSH